MVCVQVKKYTQKQINWDRRNIPRKSTNNNNNDKKILSTGFQLDVIELKKEGLTKVIYPNIKKKKEELYIKVIKANIIPKPKPKNIQ